MQRSMTSSISSRAQAPVSISELLEHSRWIARLARHLVRDQAAADDLTQDVWAAALRRPPSGGRPVQPWLATVLRNFARMRARRSRRRSARGGARVRDPCCRKLRRCARTARSAPAGHPTGRLSRGAVPVDCADAVLRGARDRRNRRTPGSQAWHRARPPVPRARPVRAKLDDECGERRRWRALLVGIAGQGPAARATERRYPLVGAAALTAPLVAIMAARGVTHASHSQRPTSAPPPRAAAISFVQPINLVATTVTRSSRPSRRCSGAVERRAPERTECEPASESGCPR